jgi:hypothetical protein
MTSGEDIASMHLKRLGYNPLRRYRGMDWNIGPTVLAEHKKGVFTPSQVQEMRVNDAVLIVTDHKSVLVFRLDRDASIFNIDNYDGIDLPEGRYSISLDIPWDLWKDIQPVIRKDETFHEFAMEALREQVKRRTQG